jgi:hypothetical protein
VAVYVRNLSTVEASGNATVKTHGKVNFLSLDVVLKENASATIDATTMNLYTVVADSASLSLSGTSADYYAVLSAAAKLNLDNFNADNSSINASNPMIAKVRTKVKPAYTLPTTNEEDFSK